MHKNHNKVPKMAYKCLKELNICRVLQTKCGTKGFGRLKILVRITKTVISKVCGYYGIPLIMVHKQEQTQF